jgi:hypothetical protein
VSNIKPFFFNATIALSFSSQARNHHCKIPLSCSCVSPRTTKPSDPYHPLLFLLLLPHLTQTQTLLDLNLNLSHVQQERIPRHDPRPPQLAAKAPGRPAQAPRKAQAAPRVRRRGIWRCDLVCTSQGWGAAGYDRQLHADQGGERGSGARVGQGRRV